MTNLNKHIYENEHGVWRFRKRIKGKLHTKYLGRGRVEDIRKLRDQELARLARGDARDHTFSEAVALFKEQHYPALKKMSRAAYDVDIKHLERIFGGVRIAGIDRRALSEFERARNAAGASGASISRSLACLSSILTTCLESEWIESNPVPVYVKLRRRRGHLKTEPRRRWFREDEMAAIFKHTLKARPRMHDFILFAHDTGLRAREQLGIFWDDIDWENGLVRVRAELAKHSKERVVPLWARTLEMLRERHALESHKSVHVFASLSGEPFTSPNSISFRFKQICKGAGVKNAQWHDLRRTCASTLIQPPNSFEITEVASWLGNTAVVAEKHYAFLDTKQLRMKRDNIERNVHTKSAQSTMTMEENFLHIGLMED